MTNRSNRKLLWTGRILSGLVIAFLLFDAIGKVLVLGPVLDATRQLGYAVEIIRPLGVVLGLATLLHAVRRTEILGALLLTAYLGGATATLVRVGQPFYFPVVMGAIMWVAMCLRNPRAVALVFGVSK